jgi:hypothetical protein
VIEAFIAENLAHHTMRIAGPEFVRTAQADQPARVTRRWICLA